MPWSNKYKKSINCKHPKGFSQRAHCAGRKKRARGGKTKSKPVRFHARSKRRSKRKTKKGGRGASGLTRWFAEEWVDVCTGRPCGRKKYSKKGMPYCRPKRRINKGTPKTARSLSREQKRKMCSRKRKNPTKKMKRV